MTIKDHNIPNSETSASSPFDNAAIVAPTTDKEAPKTTGEKAFNYGAYWGLGWVANATTSIWLTDKATQGFGYPYFDKSANFLKSYWPFATKKIPEGSAEKGAKIFEAFKQEVQNGKIQIDGASKDMPIDKIEEKIDEYFGKAKMDSGKRLSHGGRAEFVTENLQKVRPNLVSSELKHANKIKTHVKDFFKDSSAKASARSMGTLLALMSGGFLYMIPIKLLEDHKLDHVKRLDNYFSPENQRTEVEQAQFEARYHELEQEPQQTWTSELAGRMLAVIPTISIHHTFAPKDNIVSKFGKDFKGLNHYYRKYGNNIGDSLRNTHTVGKGVQKLDKAYARNLKELAKKNPEQADHFTTDPSGITRSNALVENSIIDSFYSLLVASGTYVSTRFTNELLNGNKKANCSQCDTHATHTTPQETPSSVLHTSSKDIDSSIIAEGKLAEVEQSSSRA